MHCERRPDQRREILVAHVQIARNHGIALSVSLSLSDVILTLRLASLAQDCASRRR
jgi:hypothetical protein